MKPPYFAGKADAALVAAICGDPEVRSWTAEDNSPPFDPTPWLRPPHMVVLGEGSCFLSNHLGDQTYGVHTHVLPSHRGQQALVTAGLSLMLAFLASDAETFKTMVPSNNKRAEWFTRAMGFRPTYVQKEKFLHRGVLRDLTHYTLGIDDWILQGHLVPVGREFHKLLESKGHLSHGEDYSHDCYVGAAAALMNAGRPHKAMKIYNRWARASGYVPMEIESADPLVIDVRDFKIKFEGGQMSLETKEKDYA